MVTTKSHNKKCDVLTSKFA